MTNTKLIEKIINKFISLNLETTEFITLESGKNAELQTGTNFGKVEVINEFGYLSPLSDLTKNDLNNFLNLLNKTPKRGLKKIYKTIVEVEILSEEPFDESVTDIQAIAYEINEGSWSGVTNVRRSSTLTGKKAIDAIKKQGSSPDFFQMDEKGFESAY
jgi:hypothetical protein